MTSQDSNVHSPSSVGVRSHVLGRAYKEIGSVELELGGKLENVTVAFETFGTFTGDNAVLIEHALTGDSHVAGVAGPGQPTPGWWGDIVSPGGPLDTDKWFVVCANVLGGCQGTTGPSSLHADGEPWGSRWPRITIRDQVAVEIALADSLGIQSWAAVIGGSMGGMRALEWLVQAPERVKSALLVATTSTASADQIGIQTAQISAITNDPAWENGDYYTKDNGPVAGLALARQLAHLSYRSEQELAVRFGQQHQENENALSRDVVGRHSEAGRFSVQSYLDYHGQKLVGRFDAGSYVALTDAMNTHDLARSRGSIEDVLSAINVPTIVAGVTSDRLYPIYQQEFLADHISGSSGLVKIDSLYGHDGFLIETETVGNLITQILENAEHS